MPSSASHFLPWHCLTPSRQHRLLVCHRPMLHGSQLTLDPNYPKCRTRPRPFFFQRLSTVAETPSGHFFLISGSFNECDAHSSCFWIQSHLMLRRTFPRHFLADVNVPRATCNGREQRKQGAHDQPAGLMLTHGRSISRSIERSRSLIPAPPCSKRSGGRRQDQAGWITLTKC